MKFDGRAYLPTWIRKATSLMEERRKILESFGVPPTGLPARGPLSSPAYPMAAGAGREELRSILSVQGYRDLVRFRSSLIQRAHSKFVDGSGAKAKKTKRGQTKLEFIQDYCNTRLNSAYHVSTAQLHNDIPGALREPPVPAALLKRLRKLYGLTKDLKSEEDAGMLEDASVQAYYNRLKSLPRSDLPGFLAGRHLSYVTVRSFLDRVGGELHDGVVVADVNMRKAEGQDPEIRSRRRASFELSKLSGRKKIRGFSNNYASRVCAISHIARLCGAHLLIHRRKSDALRNVALGSHVG